MRPELRPRDARDRLIVALDLPDPDAARRMVERLGSAVTFYKVGMQLVFAGGLNLLDELRRAGKRVFLDMKLLDIDNTIEAAVTSIAGLGATFTTIHAYPKAMLAAVAAKAPGGPGLLAVTVLTSMDEQDLCQAGYAWSPAELVASRAKGARDAGMDGVVCSPLEVAALRATLGADLALVVPGIRPAGAPAGDQKRVLTPGEAIAAGADYLVVGRPVTAAPDPGGAARDIVSEIEAALGGS